MKMRIDFQEKGRKAILALSGLGRHLSRSPLEQSLLNLIYFRVSQINGCAMCLDMHSKEMMEDGESAQRLFTLDAWRDAPFYTGRERAALAFAEALTVLPGGGRLISDEVYDEAKKHFSEEEIIDLVIAILSINSYNRINIAFGAPVGTYQVGQYKHLANQDQIS